MSEKMEINNPIEIKDNSVERVAFDLMEKIVASEAFHKESGYKKPNSREYFLKIYNQCHRVVSSRSANVDEILKG